MCGLLQLEQLSSQIEGWPKAQMTWGIDMVSPRYVVNILFKCAPPIGRVITHKVSFFLLMTPGHFKCLYVASLANYVLYWEFSLRGSCKCQIQIQVSVVSQTWIVHNYLFNSRRCENVVQHWHLFPWALIINPSRKIFVKFINFVEDKISEPSWI